MSDNNKQEKKLYDSLSFWLSKPVWLYIPKISLLKHNKSIGKRKCNDTYGKVNRLKK